MKQSKLIKLILLTLSFSATTSFANEKGNGGGVHYCKASGKSEMYDLFEGREIHEFKIPVQSGTIDEIDHAMIERIKQTYPSIAQKMLKLLETLPDYIRPKTDIILIPVADANIVLVKEGCAYTQLANWNDASGKLFYKTGVYQTLKTDMDKSAFHLHEIIYKVARTYLNVSDSDQVRKFNANVYSTESIESVFGVLLENAIKKADLPDEHLFYPGISFSFPDATGQIVGPRFGNRTANLDSAVTHIEVNFSREDCLKDVKYSLQVESKGDFRTLILRKKEKEYSYINPSDGPFEILDSDLNNILTDNPTSSYSNTPPVLIFKAESESCKEVYSLRMQMTTSTPTYVNSYLAISSGFIKFKL